MLLKYIIEFDRSSPYPEVGNCDSFKVNDSVDEIITIPNDMYTYWDSVNCFEYGKGTSLNSIRSNMYYDYRTTPMLFRRFKIIGMEDFDTSAQSLIEKENKWNIRYRCQEERPF